MFYLNAFKTVFSKASLIILVSYNIGYETIVPKILNSKTKFTQHLTTYVL